MIEVKQIIDRIEGELDSLEFAIKSSNEETALKLKREGAMAALQELYRFITDERWKA